MQAFCLSISQLLLIIIIIADPIHIIIHIMLKHTSHSTNITPEKFFFLANLRICWILYFAKCIRRHRHIPGASKHRRMDRARTSMWVHMQADAEIRLFISISIHSSEAVSRMLHNTPVFQFSHTHAHSTDPCMCRCHRLCYSFCLSEFFERLNSFSREKFFLVSICKLPLATEKFSINFIKLI